MISIFGKIKCPYTFGRHLYIEILKILKLSCESNNNSLYDRYVTEVIGF